MQQYTIEVGKALSFSDIELLQSGKTIKITYEKNAQQRVQKSYDFINHIPEKQIVYGINTGFGPMADTYIGPTMQQQLQYNLIRSHACGLGTPLTRKEIRTIMLIRLHTLAQGYSGVQQSVIAALAKLLEHDITPIIPEHGSVGASGDLVQLAHIALGVIGEGKCYFKGKIIDTATALNQCGITPPTLTGRDGLAFINGTAAMTGVAALNILLSERILSRTLQNTALIYQIARVNQESISTAVGDVRPHKGQVYALEVLRSYLEGTSLLKDKTATPPSDTSSTTSSLTKTPQEIYSLRCVPQIVGPIIDTVRNSKEVVLTEINSVTDNPIIYPDKVIHNGNFHGDYVALEMDKCRIAITKLSILLERQLNFLVNPKQNKLLPPFVNRGTIGLDLSVQATQFVATSTTAENQTLATPIYTHSITTNNDNQDVVSMGTNSALLTQKVLTNTLQILAITIHATVQAVDVLKIQDTLSALTKDLYDNIRKVAPPLETDRQLEPEISALVTYIETTKAPVHNSKISS